VANGEYKSVLPTSSTTISFSQPCGHLRFQREPWSGRAYGAADFMLMPSRFEPCGLPQMIGQVYGALPVAHDTGGIHDTVSPHGCGEGQRQRLSFRPTTKRGLMWAIDQAMAFYRLPPEYKAAVSRIMRSGLDTFTHDVTPDSTSNCMKNAQRP
jgi:starch synthase